MEIRSMGSPQTIVDTKPSDYAVFPQQDPGPAQPARSGVLPQQAVSFGPGNAWGVRPVSVLGADISFEMRRLPQFGHVKASSADTTSTSCFRPHSWHIMS
jgi:hypothetical protein